MRLWLGELEVEARAGVAARRLVDFAREHGEDLPDRPWCGGTRLRPEHVVGAAPLVAFARLTSAPGPDARPRPGAHLAVVGGPDAGAVATLADGLLIGRASGAGLRLRDPTVGGAHARWSRGALTDLGSPNGTSVEGKRVRRRARVHPGEVVRAGGTTLVLAGPALAAADRSNAATAARVGPGLAAGGAAGLSMAAFAVMAGHWPLAVVAVALPLASVAWRRLRHPRLAPARPLLDVTGTLGLPPLPPGPVAVDGPRALVRAVTLATGRPPTGSRQWEPWMATLGPSPREVVWLDGGEEPPSWAQVLVAARADEVTITAHGDTAVGPLPLVSAEAADASARRIAAGRDGAALPRTARWAELGAPARGSLPVRLGIGTGGEVTLDLVADGPHILVAGTTGSGKSEALRTIVGSLAHDNSPREVTFALIDFKGGASLASCARLPHVGSLLTDLEPHLARRCLLALGAELAERKRAAAASGATSFDDWRRGRPPRLVVVVDEFQEIAAADRDFLPELARLAAQGRSLGIHLVLATQRPAGAVGAAIRANIGATLALRTASEAESRDLVGSDAAARVPPSLPGRGLLLRGGALEEVQVALPLADPPVDVRLAAEPEPPGRDLCDPDAPRGPRAAPLWLPPLPESILAPGGETDFVLGVLDDPAARSRSPLVWDPAAGPLVIGGPPRSGRSTALDSVAAIAARRGMLPVWVPGDPRLAVRTLAIATELADAVLLVDDCAHTLAAAASADPEAAELLAAAMTRLPTALVVPTTWSSHRLIASAGLRLVATGVSHEDDAAWGVPHALRGLGPLAGRVRAGAASGWREAQLSWSGARSAPRAPIVRPLPHAVTTALPREALGIGTDAAVPVLAPRGASAVIGPPGPERDAVCRRVAIATGHDPAATDNAFAIGTPGSPAPRTVVCVRPTGRSVREVARSAPRGLVDPANVPFRTVAVVDGSAMALQVLPG